MLKSINCEILKAYFWIYRHVNSIRMYGFRVFHQKIKNEFFRTPEKRKYSKKTQKIANPLTFSVAFGQFIIRRKAKKRLTARPLNVIRFGASHIGMKVTTQFHL